MPLAVFRLPGKTWSVCFSKEHGWGYETEIGPAWLVNKPSVIPFLPLLEMTWPAAQVKVGEAASACEIADKFPFEAVVLTALDWETQYWPSLAVEWLEQGFPVSTASLPKLLALASNKVVPQKVRHRAAALARHAAQ